MARTDRFRRRSAPLTIAVALAVATTTPLSLHAQLISPGTLANAHSDLDGITYCTSCHSIGGDGVDPEKCLSCHEPLQLRIDSQTGYHANVEIQCEACHRDHLGAEFALVKLDESTFRHDEAGFELTGAHTDVECRDCHRPDRIADDDVVEFKSAHGALDRTFLGLPEDCVSCHSKADPHDGQFARRTCADCHSTAAWKPAEVFTHETANFTLTGRHQQAPCEGCHRPDDASSEQDIVRYVGIPAQECSDCHNDKHLGEFGTACGTCHQTESWNDLAPSALARFDHSLTGFQLLGAHASTNCQNCHRNPPRADQVISISLVSQEQPQSYPAPVHDSCESCHVDYHTQGNGIARANDCIDCHTNVSWNPTTFSIDRHNREASFQLTGVHESTPCSTCHRGESGDLRLSFDDGSCAGCHAAKSPHKQDVSEETDFTRCGDCHGTTRWTDPLFDHARTGFPLSGKHEDVACQSCHPEASYAIEEASCASCHHDNDPHRGQFVQDCGGCHDSWGFKPLASRFDHAATAFPLDGAHTGIPCESCHVSAAESSVRFVRYRPLSTQCKDCHSTAP